MGKNYGNGKQISGCQGVRRGCKRATREVLVVKEMFGVSAVSAPESWYAPDCTRVLQMLPLEETE